MGFGSHHCGGGGTTTYTENYYQIKEDEAPKENARDVKQCGCYNIRERFDSERIFDYDTTERTTYYFCQEHYIEHEEKMAKEREELRLRNIEQEKRLAKEREEQRLREAEAKRRKEQEKAEWRIKYDASVVKTEQEKDKVSRFFRTLTLPKVRQIKDVCTDNKWGCQMHKGSRVTIMYYKEGLDSAVGSSKNYYLTVTYKREHRKIKFDVK